MDVSGDVETMMGRMTCLTCRYKTREAIDKALVAGEPLRDIAGRTGLSKSSLDRHKRDHLSATLVKAAEASDLARGGKLLDQVQRLVDKALESLERAEGKGNEREVQGKRHPHSRVTNPLANWQKKRPLGIPKGLFRA